MIQFHDPRDDGQTEAGALAQRSRHALPVEPTEFERSSSMHATPILLHALTESSDRSPEVAEEDVLATPWRHAGARAHPAATSVEQHNLANQVVCAIRTSIRGAGGEAPVRGQDWSRDHQAG